MSETKKCDHAACSCMARDGSKYCSQICEDAKSMTEIACKCGHAVCRGEKLTT